MHTVYCNIVQIHVYVITKIFNHSLQKGIVPKSFKIANIIPVPKHINAKRRVEDFRPISLLSPLGKTLERIVIEGWFLKRVDKDVFHDQFAFVPLPRRGAEVALTLIYGKILRHLEEACNMVQLIMIDFSKAFDKVTKNSIINCLSTRQFPIECISWTLNYLTEREQRVYSPSTNSFSSWAQHHKRRTSRKHSRSVNFCLFHITAPASEQKFSIHKVRR